MNEVELVCGSNTVTVELVCVSGVIRWSVQTSVKATELVCGRRL